MEREEEVTEEVTPIEQRIVFNWRQKTMNRLALGDIPSFRGSIENGTLRKFSHKVKYSMANQCDLNTVEWCQTLKVSDIRSPFLQNRMLRLLSIKYKTISLSLAPSISLSSLFLEVPFFAVCRRSIQRGRPLISARPGWERTGLAFFLLLAQRTVAWQTN